MNTLNSYGIQQPKSSTTPTPAHEYQQSSTHYQPTPSGEPASEPQGWLNRFIVMLYLYLYAHVCYIFYD